MLCSFSLQKLSWHCYCLITAYRCSLLFVTVCCDMVQFILGRQLQQIAAALFPAILRVLIKLLVSNDYMIIKILLFFIAENKNRATIFPRHTSSLSTIHSFYINCTSCDKGFSLLPCILFSLCIAMYYSCQYRVPRCMVPFFNLVSKGISSGVMGVEFFQ